MQKLRIRYAKRSRLRFTSHRDFQRALERALRRAEVPMAYSAGFSPHPKVSYANAASTGAASEAEYLEISVTERCDPAQLRAALDEALPPGLDVVEVVEAGPGTLADRLTAGEWEVVLPGTDPHTVADAVEQFTARDVVEVERVTQKGRRRLDARGAVVRMGLVGRRRRAQRPGARCSGRRGGVCDTPTGRPARHTGRSTRRRPDRPSRGGWPGAGVTTPGDAHGAGAARREVRNRGRPTGPGPGRRRRRRAPRARRLAARALRRDHDFPSAPDRAHGDNRPRRCRTGVAGAPGKTGETRDARQRAH